MNATRTLLLILAAVSLIVVIGGATYEHAAMVPRWSAAAPASLAMFQGEYGAAPFRFWIPVHPITVVLLVAALALNWKTARRKFILLTLGGYAVVLAVTFAYFVPGVVAILESPYSSTIDPALTRRANLWEALSLVRLAGMFALAIILLWGLSKSGEPASVRNSAQTASS